LHKELIGNCKNFIARLNQAEQTMTVGYVQQQVSKLTPTESTGDTIIINTEVNSEDLRILTHAFIIQEWHIFLDSIFAKVITYKLYHRNMIPKIPKMNIKIDFEDIDLSTKSKARYYICDKLKETFSYDPYDEKIDKIKKLVNLQSYDTELLFIKKNVTVRNIFQHQKGIVYPRDLAKLGGSLTLLDSKNNSVAFKANDNLKISKIEINKLYETIDKITENLQVI
jgi:hypothetical protein